MTARLWRRWMAAGLLSLMPALASAEVIVDCAEWVGADTLVEPWEETSRTLSRGSVRLALVNLDEPECCPFHFAVLIPANMYGGRSCFLVGRSTLLPNGWSRVGLDEAEASRDDTPGLRVTVPVYGLDPLTGGADPDNQRVLTLRIRQAAGTVELER